MPLLIYDWSIVLQVDYKGKQETFCPSPTDSVDSRAKRESVYPEKNYDELCKLAGSSVVSSHSSAQEVLNVLPMIVGAYQILHC